METIKLSSEALRGINKAGVLKPDADGWYDVILGALEYPNSYGAIYKEGPARELLSGDSVFVRRLKKGMLYGELGHPRQQPGMTEQMFVRRLLDIQETNISHVIKDVVIDTTAKDKDGRPFIAFRGKVKPYGPHKQILIDGFNDPSINVAFSIRSFTQDKFVNGKLEKHFKSIITWDLVHEPGIDVAVKVNSPSLESYYDITVSSNSLEGIVSDAKKYGMESSALSIQAQEILSTIRQENVVDRKFKVEKPSWLSHW